MPISIDLHVECPFYKQFQKKNQQFFFSWNFHMIFEEHIFTLPHFWAREQKKYFSNFLNLQGWAIWLVDVSVSNINVFLFEPIMWHHRCSISDTLWVRRGFHLNLQCIGDIRNEILQIKSIILFLEIPKLVESNLLRLVSTQKLWKLLHAVTLCNYYCDVNKSIHFWNGNKSKNPFLISNFTENAGFSLRKWQKITFLVKKKLVTS